MLICLQISDIISQLLPGLKMYLYIVDAIGKLKQCDLLCLSVQQDVTEYPDRVPGTRQEETRAETTQTKTHCHSQSK